MGGTVTSVPRTAAERTVVLLQEAVHNGLPVLIPGARETHVGGAADRRPDHPERPAMDLIHTTTVSDRERLEREQEGGGAPRERNRGRRATILSKLWRTMRHPTTVAVIWSPVLPQ